ncbi:hypothetical protein PG996_005176 [Apiospora saccharicola]|uniref:Uncharacterized protein n=1 Tax=Apiospora saccharicola TaxID=335842 RepID=A0ABR1VKT9_9PEZI
MSSNRPQTANTRPQSNRLAAGPRISQYLLPNTLVRGGGRHVPYSDESGSEYVPSLASAVSSQTSGSTDWEAVTVAAPSPSLSDTGSLGSRQIPSVAPSISSQSVDSAATPIPQARVSQGQATPRSSAGTESSSGRGVSSRPTAVTAPGPDRAPLSPRDANAVVPGPSQGAKAKRPSSEVHGIHTFRTVFNGLPINAVHDNDTIRDGTKRLPSNGEMVNFLEGYDKYEGEFQAEPRSRA